MDRVHEYLQSEMNLHNFRTLDNMIAWYATWAGTSWIHKYDDPAVFQDVEDPELEVRSALEFIRPELTPAQLESLNVWDQKYLKWREEGVFYRRYREVSGPKFSWQDERNSGETELGRSIPKSHWWYWPKNEKFDVCGYTIDEE